MKYLFYILLFVCSTATARIEIQQFDNPAQEQIYKQLIAELRCLVCQNQNLADSNAALAKDLRNKTFEMVKAGKQQSEIVAYMVARYGDFVLYKPPLKARTLLLWFGPAVILLCALIAFIVYLRKRKKQMLDAPYSAEQLEQARKMLSQSTEE